MYNDKELYVSNGRKGSFKYYVIQILRFFTHQSFSQTTRKEGRPSGMGGYSNIGGPYNFFIRPEWREKYLIIP